MLFSKWSSYLKHVEWQEGDEKMTDVIIVHSKFSDSTNHWYDWLANNLRLEGYDVTLVDISIDEDNDINQWVEKMDQQIHIDKHETYLLTHGFGTLAALKYIEQKLTFQIEGLFSISGFREDAQDIDESIVNEDIEIDYNKVKQRVERFYGLCAKNDKHVSYKETKRLMDTLGGYCKVAEYGGHFLAEDGFTSFTALQGSMMGIMSD